jgi:hypothetical protein
MNKLRSLIESGFIDREDGTILDTHTNLVWQKSPLDKKFTWEGAKKHCESFTLAGYNNWRLPTIEEFEALINKKYYPTMDTIFDCEPDWYWSSSANAYDPFYIWLINFRGGYMNSGSKIAVYFVRAVRRIDNA